MSQERKHYAPEEKATIQHKHLRGMVAVSRFRKVSHRLHPQ